MHKYERSEMHREDASMKKDLEESIKETSPTPEDSSNDPLLAVQEELAKQKDLQLRALADLDNLRRRFAREREDLIKTGTAALIEALIPALDSFRIGFNTAQNHPETSELTRGFKMAYDQLLQALAQHGLHILEPIGELFDPHVHDCLAQRPAEGAEEGIILDVIAVGYRLADKLIRPAKVIIAQATSH